MRWHLLVSLLVSFCSLYDTQANLEFDLSRIQSACRTTTAVERKQLGIAEGICELLRETEARRHSGILKS